MLAHFLAPTAHAQSITWIKYDPAAIRADRTAPATIELVTAGVAGVRLDYAVGGGSLTLTSAALVVAVWWVLLLAGRGAARD